MLTVQGAASELSLRLGISLPQAGAGLILAPQALQKPPDKAGGAAGTQLDPAEVSRHWGFGQTLRVVATAPF